MKKIVTSLMLAVLAATCAIAFVGCGKGDGACVTEAEWDEAFLNARAEMNYSLDITSKYDNETAKIKALINENAVYMKLARGVENEESFEVKANDGLYYTYDTDGDLQKTSGSSYNVGWGGRFDGIFTMFTEWVQYSDLKYDEDAKVFKCDEITPSEDEDKSDSYYNNYTIKDVVVEFNDKQLSRVECAVEAPSGSSTEKGTIKMYDFGKTEVTLPEKVDVSLCDKADKAVVKALLNTLPAENFTLEITSSDVEKTGKVCVSGDECMAYTKNDDGEYSKSSSEVSEYYSYALMNDNGLAKLCNIAGHLQKLVTKDDEGDVYRAIFLSWTSQGYVEITIKDGKVLSLKWTGGNNYSYRYDYYDDYYYAYTYTVYDIGSTEVTAPESPLKEESSWNAAVAKLAEERNYHCEVYRYGSDYIRLSAYYTKDAVLFDGYMDSEGNIRAYGIEPNDKGEYYWLTRDYNYNWTKSEYMASVSEHLGSVGDWTDVGVLLNKIKFEDINSEPYSISNGVFTFECNDTLFQENDGVETWLTNIRITFKDGGITDISASLAVKDGTYMNSCGNISFNTIGTTEIDLPYYD